MKLPEKVREKLRDIPDKPGCYMMRDRRGRIIYVGRAVSLRKRVQSYFRESSLRRGDPKLRGLVHHTHDLDYIVVRSEAEAVLTEGQLIKDYRPRYNVSFKDDKRFLLLRGQGDAVFPSLKLCRIRRDDGADYFGPFASSSAARSTLDFVEKTFGLRKCRPRLPDEETYKHCINDIVRYCSAPCVGKIDEQTYRERYDEACAFLEGKRPATLQALKEAMEAASANLEFERAAALRDTWFDLRRTIEQRGRVASTPAMKREAAAKGIEELGAGLGMPAPPRVIEAYDISNISGTYSVAGMVCFVDGMPAKSRYRRFKIRTVAGIDDPAMMAEVLQRRFARLKREQESFPDLVLVDGGITQRRAAVRELAALGLRDLSVIGLAKRFEEVYWTGSEPVRFAEDSLALKVLQRVRDEAHRFALDYHRRLRGRRIRESVLDDVPGIGKKRKQALLSRFGSVSRLAAASAEDIAAVPGIGYDMAEAILEAVRSGSGS